MRFFVQWMYRSFFALLCVAVCSFIVIFGGLFYFGKGLPNHHSLEQYNPNVSSTVYLADGTVLKEFSLEKRFVVRMDRIPEKLKNAFLAAEDYYFYEHMGVDPLSIIRSLFNNFVNAGSYKRPQGASTITQQVARIFLIGSNELKYERKIKEAILAFRIEHSLSKDKILELYFNQIYLGAGTYGVAAAAKTYFGKALEELTISECAMLAALAKGATHYSPILHPGRAVARRNWVLKRMLDGGFITKDEYELALISELELIVQHNDCRADYYAEEVRKEIRIKCSIDSINKDGLVIRVPLDMSMQKAAEQALREGLERIDRAYGWRGPIANIKFESEAEALESLKKLKSPAGAENYELAMFIKNKGNMMLLLKDGSKHDVPADEKKWMNASRYRAKNGDITLCIRHENTIKLKQIPEVQGAIVAMNPHTGKVLAMQGGYSFGRSKFNRATQAYRQPGSVFKPVVYLTALSSGLSPASLIDGSPISIMIGDQLWEPHNFKNEIVGNVTMRTGLERSLNTVTVNLARQVGISNIARMSEKLGVYDRAPNLWSIVLGSVETTLLRLVNAYSIIANGGRRISPVLIDQIQDKSGKTIYRSEDVDVTAIKNIGFDSQYPPRFLMNKSQILDAQSTYQLISLLMGSVQSGTSRGALQLGIPLAGKTGTSNDSRDNWFIGFTPNIVVGVMVCFDDNARSLGKRATGASNALPIFVNFMKLANLTKEKIPFKVPEGISFKYINKQTGTKCKQNEQGSFLEAFKEDNHVNEIVIHSTDDSTDSAFESGDSVGSLIEITGHDRSIY